MTWPSVRGIGVAVISSTWGAPRTAFDSSALRCSTPNRCCSSTTARARSANASASWSRACVPTTTGAWPVSIASIALRRAGAGRDPVSRITGTPRSSSSEATRGEVLAGEEVRRGEQRGLAPGERGGGERPRGDGGLAGPDVALDEPEHRDRPREVRRGSRRSRPPGPAVSSTGRSSLRDRDPARAARMRPSRAAIHGERLRPRPAAGPPPGDHAQLERQELVEGQPAERGVAGLEGRRVVGRLERLGDARQRLRRDRIAGGRYSG